MATGSETSYLLVGLVAQSVISAADMPEQRMAATGDLLRYVKRWQPKLWFKTHIQLL
jgi:hypothetical protein